MLALGRDLKHAVRTLLLGAQVALTLALVCVGGLLASSARYSRRRRATRVVGALPS
jgi:hypothetical protein